MFGCVVVVCIDIVNHMLNILIRFNLTESVRNQPDPLICRSLTECIFWKYLCCLVFDIMVNPFTYNHCKSYVIY